MLATTPNFCFLFSLALSKAFCLWRSPMETFLTCSALPSFFGCGSSEWSFLSDHWRGALSWRWICAFTAWREIYLVCNLDFGVKQLQCGAGEDFHIIELWSKVRLGSSGEATACKFRPAPFSVALNWSGRDEDLVNSHKGELWGCFWVPLDFHIGNGESFWTL